MSHLDEGTLHALLDGELGSTELDGDRGSPGRVLGMQHATADARASFSKRPIGSWSSVQFGDYASTPDRIRGSTADSKPEPAPQPPERPSREHHPWDDASPVLLIPDNPESSPLIRRWPKFVGWAAMIAFVVSGGFLASNFAKESPASMPTSPDAGSTIATGTDSDVPANAAPSARRDSDPSVLANDAAPADVGLRQAPAKPAPPKPAPVKSAQAKPAPPTPSGRLTERRPLPMLSPPRRLGQSRKTRRSPARADSADAAEEAATKAAEQESVRLQAAEALNQLDRERRVNRAAAATAALDQQAAARRVTPTPAAPPPPPTPEQRSQVYLRIGLDEANRQLGGPVHVIEGLNPLFMGLAPGRVAVGGGHHAPGRASGLPGRPGPHDRPRSTAFASRSGALPAGAWSLGDVTMGLQGDVPPEVLRSLRSRVR